MPGLVLTRRDGQRTIITTPEGRKIIVGVEIHLGHIRMRVEADRDVSILREELLGTPAVEGEHRG